MIILLIGAGAREHTIAWKLCQGPRVDALFVAPGNAGTAAIATNLPIRVPKTDAPPAERQAYLDEIAHTARELKADLVAVGPEDPLAWGLVDRLAVEGIAAFGPSKAAARLEASKAFCKDLCQRYAIPHARGASFTSRTAACNYVMHLDDVPVVKADGLAAGKGVLIPDTKEEALAAIDAMMSEGLFGEAGRTVVIEERLSGREVSVFAFTDGRTVVPMVPACDYKRIFDGDQGPNTGGMGSYSPPPWYDAALAETVRTAILEPAVRAMQAEGSPYRGVLYGGLMMTDDGPKVLEFNCRFGDPEAQVTLPRLKSDLAEVLWAVAMNRLHEVKVEWSDQACVGVVMASGGYPDQYDTGFPIHGLGSVEDDALVFHAGTRLDDDGQVVTSGGRVLTVAALAPTLAEARTKAYRNVQHVHFSRCHYRRDIAAPSQHAVVE
ncbi:MAG: phosphoribosylamine--glycine ligase [Chloroflexota bacterium]|nr:phosphoribosylamine--glycine ligase [Chloroflexota bacterium]